MPNTFLPTRTHDSSPRLTVSALVAQVELGEPRGTVTVKGVVGELKGYPREDPKWIYGSLKDTDGSSVITFRCSIGAGPSDAGEYAVLQGTLKLKPSNRSTGYELHLIGCKIGTWTPNETITGKQIVLNRISPKRPLARFIENGSSKQLLFIGTRTALQDAENSFYRLTGRKLLTLEVSFSRERIEKAIVAAEQPDGLCFLRGGGDPDTFSLWNDRALVAQLLQVNKPFFTALGHTADYTLADRFSDESFTTPTEVGTAYAEALNARAERDKLESERNSAVEAYRQLQVDHARALGQQEAASARELNQLHVEKAGLAEQKTAEVARMQQQLRLEMDSRDNMFEQRERAFKQRRKRDLQVMFWLGGVLILAVLEILFRK